MPVWQLKDESFVIEYSVFLSRPLYTCTLQPVGSLGGSKSVGSRLFENGPRLRAFQPLVKPSGQFSIFPEFAQDVQTLVVTPLGLDAGPRPSPVA